MIRNATRGELAEMADWAAAEGWNPGLEDADAFWGADPQGFFVSLHEGEIAACISVVNHSASFAFLGFYICAPQHRGKGLGLALWAHAMAHAGTRTVGLDGVEDQQANYARSGFVRTGATTRFAGRMTAESAPQTCRLARAEDLPTLIALDRAAVGIDRPDFLAGWCAPSRTRQTFVLDTQDAITGFATIRACREGAKIGPVIAPDAASAMALIRTAAARYPSGPHFVDVPSACAALQAQLRQLGFETAFETARMYKGSPPGGDGSEWAIASMELG